MDYQKKFSIYKPTASRDLEDMVKKGILHKIGITGKGAYYTLNRKGLVNGSNGSMVICREPVKSAIKEQKRQDRNGSTDVTVRQICL